MKSAAELQQPIEPDNSDDPDDDDVEFADRIYQRMRYSEEEARSPEFSDDNLVLMFAAENAGSLRYVARLCQWFRWDGKRWAEDDVLAVYDAARRTCRVKAADCNKHKTAVQIASAKTVNAVVTLARADTRIAATVDQWDRDKMALNTPAGILDLRTGRLRPHRPEDYCTKITAVAPGGKCPLFLRFLARITADDVDLQNYIAKVLGYGCTGDTKEHALFFIHGYGSNGKSVLLNTVASILGDYSKTAPIETFTASNTDRHPTDLAGLRGARLVTAVETDEGRPWAEARIKTLTGGDKIAARFMRQDFFEYTPQFKLVIAGNHKPGLRSVDEAIRRRFHLIPFNVTIAPEERDPALAEKLRAEWPGILQWMIDGCLAWQRDGLRPTKAVAEATAEYLESEDALSAWIAERCMMDAHAWTSTSELYADWCQWADRAGETPRTARWFSQNVEKRSVALGIRKDRSRTARGFAGLQLIPQMTGHYS